MIRQLNQWTFIHALIIGLCSFLYLYFEIAYFFIVPVLLSFIYILYATRSEREWFGYANGVTFCRILACLLVLVLPLKPILAPLLILIAVAVLDGLDGYLARRFNESSDMGAYFDKETDALFVMVLCFILYKMGRAPFAILGLGWLRYITVLVFHFIISKAKKESRFKIGQIIAVITMIGLMAAMILPEPYRGIDLILVSVFLVFSFARSSYYQLIG